MDDLITIIINSGFDVDDLKHLERLSDVQILRTLPSGQRYLQHNVKSDVVCYLRGWADLLESRIVENVSLGDLEPIMSEA